MFKRMARGVLLLAGLLALTASALPSSYFIPLDLVERIQCDAGSGSGSWIDNDAILTAAHVESAGHCMVRGQPTETVYVNGALDLAVLRPAMQSPVRIPLACDVPVTGRPYFATGFAHGTDFVVQRLEGTGEHWSPTNDPSAMDIYRGRIIPGMSGGPIFDDRGYIVGIVNAAPADGRDLSISRSLVGTYLCPAPSGPTQSPTETQGSH